MGISSYEHMLHLLSGGRGYEQVLFCAGKGQLERECALGLSVKSLCLAMFPA